MRLRNLFVLSAFTAMSLGVIACGKKTEEVKPADSMMTPAPAPPPAPAPTPAAIPDIVKKAGEDIKKEGDKMDKKGDQIKKEG
jgi:hypothetical protein